MLLWMILEMTCKCLVVASQTVTGVLTVKPYNAANLIAAGIANSANNKIFVYGSEFQKGTSTGNDCSWS